MRRHIASFLLLATAVSFAFPAFAQTAPTGPTFSQAQIALIARVDSDAKDLRGWYDWYTSTGHVGSYRHPEYIPEIIEYRGKYNAAFFHAETILRIKPETLAALNADGADNNYDHYYSGGQPVKVKRADTLEFYRQRCITQKKLIEKAEGVMLELLEILKKASFSDAVIAELDNQVRDSVMLNGSNAVGLGNLDACMLYYADAYYIYHLVSEPSGPNNAFMCVANFIIDKSKAPDPDGDGICVEHRVSPWNWGKPPKCVHNCDDNDQSIPMQNAGGYPLWFPRYFMYEPANRPSPTNPTGGIDYYQDAINRIDGQLDFNRETMRKATEEIVKVAEADAAAQQAAEEKRLAALRADALSKGSALALPLPLSNISVGGVVARVIRTMMGVVGSLALVLFTWGGIRWMLARGNPDEVAKAKKTIVWTTLGLLAIFSSYAILATIIEALK